MPRKKDPFVEEDAAIDVMGLLSHKKHKKHKHKKHKKRRGEADSDVDEGSEDASPSASDSKKLGLKLKIKIGGHTFGETRFSNKETGENISGEAEQLEMGDPTGLSPSNPPKKGRKVDEEEAWLEAVEAGRLEEVDEELRRMKDPTLMTARQRSLLESKAQKDKEEAAPPTVQEEKELTEEMIQRKIIRAKKRKEQAQEKQEKDKKQTIERLLKKTDSKIKGTRKFAKKTDVPKVTYIDSEIRGLSLSLPSGFDFPLESKKAPPPPPPLLCGVKGCGNVKKYSCSKTGVPLCSLECYRKNLSTFPVSKSISVA